MIFNFSEADLSFFLIALLLFIVAISVVYFMRMYHKKMVEQHEQIIKKQNETEIDVRQKMAFVLHEEIAKNLTFIQWNVNKMQDILVEFDDNAETDEAKEYCQEIENQTNLAKQRVKFLHNSIFPPSLLILSFEEASFKLLADLQKTFEGKIEFTPEGNFTNLSKEQKYNLYGLINLFVSNSVLHGNASEILISLHEKDKKIKLRLKDNGKGFDMNEVEKNSSGRGIFDIRSRAIALLPLQFIFISEIDKGTFLYIEIICT